LAKVKLKPLHGKDFNLCGGKEHLAAIGGCDAGMSASEA
jgi:hypothetical protein